MGVRSILMTLALAGLLANAAAAQAPTAPDQVRTLDRPGAKLHYVERGTGPLVVLVHGSLGEFADWKPELDALSAHYHVVAYSRRFHPPNATPRAGESYSMAQQADDLAALIRAKGAPARIVAHSYGAYTSLYMALHHPELVHSLVLAEPPILGWLNESKEGRAAARQFQQSALLPARAAFARGDNVDGLRRFIDGVTGHPVFDQMPATAKAQLAMVAPEMRAEMTSAPSVYMRPVTCSQVHRFTKPVLVLSAERSANFFHIITDRLARCLAHPRTGTVPEASHGSMVSTASFQTQVDAFLDAD